MVYLGKPSRGCAVCRKRKIKCDEALPGCSYCFKKQIVCPGYKSYFDLAWKDQNVVAEKSVQRRKKATRDPNRDHTESENSPAIQLFMNTPSQDFQSYAVSFFFSTYIHLPRDLGDQRGFLETLHPAWSTATPTSPLIPAVAAVASVMLEAWSQIPTDSPASFSRGKFAEAIASLNLSLRESEVVGDDALLASLMLDMYENLRAFFLMSSANRSPHIHGVGALIRQRKQLRLSDTTSKEVLQGARSHFVNRALRDKTFVPKHIASWRTNEPRTTGECLDELNVEVANLQALTSTGVETLESRLELQTQILELDLDLLKWAANVPKDWTPIQVSGEACVSASIREAGLYQQQCLVYKSIFIANTFNSYYSSRIKLQIALMACNGGTFIDSALENVQTLADAICASIPFYLGDRTEFHRIDDKGIQYPHLLGILPSDEHHLAAAAYGGWMITGRLLELLSPNILLRAGQKQWIGGQLGRIQRIYAVHTSG